MRKARNAREVINSLAQCITETLEQRTLLTALPVLPPSQYPGTTTQLAYASAAPASANQAPTDITFSPTTRPGSQWASNARGTLSAADPDVNDTFTYSLVSGTGSKNNADFTITGNTLCMESPPPLAPYPGYSVRIRATDSGGLWVEKAFTLNWSGPDFEVGHWGGAVNAVAVSGNLGYVAQSQDLVVLDLSDPQQPRELGRAMLPDIVQGLAVSGQYAYVTTSTWDLQVIDLSDPAHPSRVPGVDLPGITGQISIAGNYAYVAGGFQGAQVVDISNPTAPVLVGLFGPHAIPDPSGVIYLGGSVDAIAIAGSYAYTACSYNDIYDMQVFDITNAAAPVLISQGIIGGIATDLTLAGSYLYAGVGSDLKIVDITDPAAPASITSFATPGDIEDITIAGDYAYVADGGNGLRILDIRDPATPTEAGHFDTNGYAYAAVVSGSHAYIVNGRNGLQIIDVATPSTPAAAGRYGGAANANAVAVAGNYAYVGDKAGSSQVLDPAGGVQILDVSNPAAPRQVGDVVTVGGVAAIAALGGYAYLAEGSSGLEILDVSNPAAPVSVGRFTTFGTVSDLAVAGNYLYVASGANGLCILDITNPAAPISVGSVGMSSITDVVILGNYAYITSTASVQIVDISNPAAPVLAAAYTPSAQIRGLTVAGHYLYLVTTSYLPGPGIEIVDISNPVAPVRVSWTANKVGPGIAVAGDLAFLTADDAVQVFDIANPAAPARVGGWNVTPSDGVYVVTLYNHGAIVADGHVYLPNHANGLAIFDASAYANQAPTDLVFSTAAVKANQGAGMTVGAFATTDVNDSDAFTYTLVSGLGDADNAAFTISGNTLQMKTNLGYEAGGSYSIRVRSTDRDGLWFEKAFTISVTDPDTTAPAVSSVLINDGAVQRSMVRKLSVVFSEAVVLSTGAVQVRLKDGTLPPNTTVTIANPSADQKTYILTFSVYGVTGGSLADGIYDLVVSATGIQDLAGNPLTANYTQRFHRLFGDSDGNRIVNALDYARLKQTFGRWPSNPLFNSAFDYEGNNLINALDLARFRQRYGMSYSY